MGKIKDQLIDNCAPTGEANPLPPKSPYFPLRGYTVVDLSVSEAVLEDQEQRELSRLLDKCNSVRTTLALTDYIEALEGKLS